MVVKPLDMIIKPRDKTVTDLISRSYVKKLLFVQ